MIKTNTKKIIKLKKIKKVEEISSSVEIRYEDKTIHLLHLRPLGLDSNHNRIQPLNPQVFQLDSLQ